VIEGVGESDRRGVGGRELISSKTTREAMTWKKRGGAMHVEAGGETARQESHLICIAYHFGSRKDVTFPARCISRVSGYEYAV
jgi:hypothetical protein